MQLLMDVDGVVIILLMEAMAMATQDLGTLGMMWLILSSMMLET